MAPPCHAVVLSIDEKSQIQALDRSQPGLPLKPGKCATMTHDYKRNGTTTLFAALNVLDGTVLGRCMDKHRHQEFIKFLNAVERAVPVGKVITPSSTITPPMSIPRSDNGWPSSLGVPFHPDIGVLAQRRRKLLLRHHSKTHPARRLQVGR